MKQKALPKKEEQTNLQFKLLSAIGIIIIVSGHCYHGGISLAYEWFPTYSFNISLFVFISGYFYKAEYEQSALRYIWKRCKRLVIPAYLWNIAYGLSWFVYPMFLVCVLNVLFRKLCGKTKIKNEYFILALYLAVGMWGIQLAADGHNSGMLKLLTRTMLFLPCFQLGRLYNTRWEQRDTLDSVSYFSILFAVQLLILTLFDNLEYTPSSMAGFKNGVLLPYITSITGIAFWLRVSRLLTPVVKNCRLVRLIANNTYSIMIHQMLGFMCVKWLFYILGTVTALFPDFDGQTMLTIVWYYYLPKGLQQYGMVYLAGGIFVPIAIKKLCDLDKSAKEYLFVQPVYNSRRMVNQRGAFIAFKNVTAINERVKSIYYIEPKEKEKILKELMMYGIDESFIYPELDHKCSSVKEKYKSLQD